MPKISFKVISNILGVFAVFAFVATPTMSIADASNPGATRMHKAKAKHRARHRVVRAKVRTPAPAQPVEVVQVTPEAPMPMPEPAPAPQVVEAPPAPATAPAAPLAVAKSGKSGWLLGVLGAAAVIAGVVVLSDSNKKPASA
jgi:hypothetical protein